MNKLVLYKPVPYVYLGLNFGEAGDRGLYAAQGMLGHDGLDLAASSWQPVYASHDGIVTLTSVDLARGLGVELTTKEPRHFLGTPYNTQGDYYAKTVCWHFAANAVKEGQDVKTGQLLGWADNTGNSSGDHLHFGLYPMLRNEDGTFSVAFPKNGFYGALSPVEYIASQLTAFEKNSFTRRIRYQFADLLNQSRLTG